MQSGCFDMCFVVAYVPPRPQLARHQRHYENSVTALSQWLRGVINVLPARCTPMGGFDLNDGLGCSSELSAEILPSENAIGPVGATEEHIAGSSMREFFDGATPIRS